MYAIIEKGSQQYKVMEGDTIDVDLHDQEIGSTIEFKEVLLIADGKNTKMGAPHVKNGVVKAQVLGPSKGEKSNSLKYERGNHYRRFGHRQHYTQVKITSITA